MPTFPHFEHDDPEHGEGWWFWMIPVLAVATAGLLLVCCGCAGALAWLLR